MTFEDLPRRLVVNTVDLNTGQQVLWGLPGLRDAKVADAVFASCALPGILPPRAILGRYCIDGAVLENLPVRAALAVSRVPIIAVDVGGTRVERTGVERKGFVSKYSRGLEIVMQTLGGGALARLVGAAGRLVRPRARTGVDVRVHGRRFSLRRAIRAMNEALDCSQRNARAPSGDSSTREVRVMWTPRVHRLRRVRRASARGLRDGGPTGWRW